MPLSPSPTSWAETLILRKEFLPWPQHTGHATCNLQIMVITECVRFFQRAAPAARAVRAERDEAGEVGTPGPQPAASRAHLGSVETSLHLLHLQHGGNKCIYHARRLRGSKELIQALSTCLVLMLH